MATKKPSAGATKGELLGRAILRSITLPGEAAEYTCLCDVGEVDHVCSSLLDAFAARRLGGDIELAAGIRRHLVEPLTRYVEGLLPMKRDSGVGDGDRMERDRTLELLRVAADVLQRLDSGPWTEQDGADAARELHVAWCTWIAYVASYWLSQVAPSLMAQREVRRAQGRMGGLTPKNGADRSTGKAGAIRKLYAELSTRFERRNVASMVAKRLDVTPSYVRGVMRTSVDKKAKLKAAL